MCGPRVNRAAEAEVADQHSKVTVPIIYVQSKKKKKKVAVIWCLMLSSWISNSLFIFGFCCCCAASFRFSKDKPFPPCEPKIVCHTVVSINKYENSQRSRKNMLYTQTEGKFTIKSLRLWHDTELVCRTAKIPLNKIHIYKTHSHPSRKKTKTKKRNCSISMPKIYFASTWYDPSPRSSTWSEIFINKNRPPPATATVCIAMGRMSAAVRTKANERKEEKRREKKILQRREMVICVFDDFSAKPMVQCLAEDHHDHDSVETDWRIWQMEKDSEKRYP